MRDVVETSLGWAVVIGLVLAVVLGMRRGKAQRAAAIAQAHAEGRAEVTAELAAISQSNVNVAVDASHRTVGDASFHECADPWNCPTCLPLLHAVAFRANRGRVVLDEHNVHDDSRVHNFYFDGSGVRGVPVASGRDDAARASGFGRGHRGSDVGPPASGA